jgi:hypothetical protein
MTLRRKRIDDFDAANLRFAGAPTLKNGAIFWKIEYWHHGEVLSFSEELQWLSIPLEGDSLLSDMNANIVVIQVNNAIDRLTKKFLLQAGYKTWKEFCGVLEKEEAERLRHIAENR